MWIMKNNVLILLISIQKLYFCDDEAIYDVIIQEPVWKWRHNYRHEISISKSFYFTIKSLPVKRGSFVVSEKIRPTGNRFINFR